MYNTATELWDKRFNWYYDKYKKISDAKKISLITNTSQWP